MKKHIIILSALLLSGCSFSSMFVQKEVVVETKYVVRTASAAQKEIPPYPQAANPETANQLDLAKWIRDSEQRTWRLESIIEELVKFYEAPVTEEERKKLEEKTKAENAKK